MPECGFNNLEQGILIALALGAAGSLFWIALATASASLRSIETAHHLRRIAEALEAMNDGE